MVEKLDKYLKLRHNLTHDFNPRIRLNPSDICKLHANLSDVIAAADIVFQEDVFVPNVVEKFPEILV